MMKRVNENIPIDIHERVRLMIRNLLLITLKKWISSMIGDSDNGRLLPFENNVFNDHKYLLGIYSNIHHSNYFSKFRNHGSIDSFSYWQDLTIKKTAINNYLSNYHQNHFRMQVLLFYVLKMRICF